MKKTDKNIFKKKLNEVEFKASQADWKVLSSQLDKQIPVDIGIGANTIATKTSVISASLLAKITAIISLAAFSFLTYKNLSIEKSLQNNQIQTVETAVPKNQSNNLEQNESRIKIIDSKNLQAANQEITVKKDKISTPESNKLTRIAQTTSAVTVKNSPTVQIKQTDNRQESSASLRQFEKNPVNLTIVATKDLALEKRIKKSPANTSLVNASNKEKIAAETKSSFTLPNTFSALAFSENTNSLTAYTEALSSRLNAKENLLEKLENKRFQLALLLNGNYTGLKLEFTEKVRSFPGTILHMGLGYQYEASEFYTYGSIFTGPGSFSEETVHILEENSVFFVAELKKFLWKDRLSAFGSLKPEYVFIRYGREGIVNPDNSISTYYGINKTNRNVNNLLVSAAVGFDYRFTKRMEFRIGYEHSLNKNIKNNVAYLGLNEWARHFQLGLNYNFTQKIK